MIIYDYVDYIKFLSQALGETGKRTGLKSKLAEHVGCQTAFVSQVLSGTNHFSLEHAERITQFFKMDEEASHYFMLLVQCERAGSHTLKGYFQKQINQLRIKREKIAGRVPSDNFIISAEAQNQYYSSWIFGAVHVALSIPRLQTPKALSEHFNLSLVKIEEVLRFLEEAGLAVRSNSKWLIGPYHTHLAKSSAHLIRHHANWRIKSLTSLDEPRDDDLHYSLVCSLSKIDLAELRKQTLSFIESTVSTIKNSPEEELAVFNVDFIKL